MLSSNLEQTLHRALSLASERRHEYATLEHLLLGLTDDTDAALVLRALGVDLDKLRQGLSEFLDKDLSGLATDNGGEPKPTASFERVVQRAAIRVQNSGSSQVTGANVLLSLFSESESHAVNFINHGDGRASGRTQDILAINLEQTLHRALRFASEHRHEYATLEHLLLGLTDDSDAAPVLRACEVDLDKLRQNLSEFLDKELTGLVTNNGGDPKPTEGFQRVVQRAAIRVKDSGSQVTGANVLVALFSESESHAVNFLQLQGMTEKDAINFVSHDITKTP